MDFVVLGATGDEGRIASKYLLEEGHSVLLCGRNPSAISDLIKHKKARFEYVDLNDIKKTASILKKSGAKTALNCAEFTMNINAMKACLIAGLNYLDLGGLHEMTIKQYKLDMEFKRRNLFALLGCGSTPGISNVMAAYAVSKLDSVEHIELGFAWKPNMNEFITPYSIESIVYELTTLPTILRDGKFKKTQACSAEGITHFKGIGRQNTYCIVHSEVFTFHKYFKNKGLKDIHYKAGFPEYSHNIINTLINLGFTSKEPIEIGKTEVKPIDFTKKALKKIKMPEGYKEFEDIWVKADGERNKKKIRIEMDCLGKTLKGWEFAGSNVNTGMTIAIMAELLDREVIKGKGVAAPEAAVPPLEFFEELKRQGFKLYMDNKPL